MVGTCEYGNEPSGSIKFEGNFFKQVSFSSRTVQYGVSEEIIKYIRQVCM
jgi:hypothetical protein